MPETETTIQTLAAEAGACFETATRSRVVGGSGELEEDRYVRVKDGSPEWVTELVHAAHDDMLPDDWRYEKIADALEYIAEVDDPDDSGEFADQAVDIYTGARLAWLASHLSRPGYLRRCRVRVRPRSRVRWRARPRRWRRIGRHRRPDRLGPVHGGVRGVRARSACVGGARGGGDKGRVASRAARSDGCPAARAPFPSGARGRSANPNDERKVRGMTTEARASVELLTNRQRLELAVADIRQVQENMVIGPTAYEALGNARVALERAMVFALDEDEQDGLRSRCSVKVLP